MKHSTLPLRLCVFARNFIKSLHSENDRTGPQYFNPEVPLCESRKSPKTSQDKPYAGDVGYGYHLDAGLLATYLREKAIARGVHHIVDDFKEKLTNLTK